MIRKMTPMTPVMPIYILIVIFIFITTAPAVSNTAGDKLNNPQGKKGHYIFKTRASANELGTVLDMTRGPGGYMWLGTETGVVRFDGRQFTQVEIFPGSSTKRITALMSAAGETLWYCTFGSGVVRRGASGITHYTTANGLPSDFITAIAEDKQHNTWFGSAGGGVIRLRNGDFISVTQNEGLSHNNVTALAAVAKGHLWVGTEKGLNLLITNQTDPEANQSIAVIKDGLPVNHITALTVDGKGNLWVGMPDGLSVVTHKETGQKQGGTFKTISIDSMRGQLIHALLRVEPGMGKPAISTTSIWAATGSGVYRPAIPGTGKGKPEKVTQRFDTPKNFSEGSVIALYEDSEGIVWFGTSGSGLSCLLPTPFRNYSIADGLSHPQVTAIYGDEKGNAWIGTKGGGLNRFRQGKFDSFTKKDNGLHSNWETSLFGNRGGVLWIGTPVGLNRFKNGVIETVTLTPGEGNPFIRALFVDAGGNTWIGTGSGLKYIPQEMENNPAADKGATRFYKIKVKNKGPDNLFVTAVTGGSDGSVWVGTRSGVYIFNGENFRQYSTKDGLADNFVTGIYTAAGGVVWIVTNSGLNRFKEGKGTPVTFNDFPIAKNITGLCEDNMQRLWFTTPRGMFCLPTPGLSLNSGTVIDRLDVYHFGGELLRNPVFSGGQSGIWKDSNGALWFASAGGVTVLPETRKLFRSSPQQRVHIEKITVDGIEAPQGGIHYFPTATGKVEIMCNAPAFKTHGKI
ncbi:MAG: hypothetical protein GY757_20365, partial [bacterium]|nr:hypothetical protein [bacterium]